MYGEDSRVLYKVGSVLNILSIRITILLGEIMLKEMFQVSIKICIN